MNPAQEVPVALKQCNIDQCLLCLASSGSIGAEGQVLEIQGG